MGVYEIIADTLQCAIKITIVVCVKELERIGGDHCLAIFPFFKEELEGVAIGTEPRMMALQEVKECAIRLRSA